MCIYDIYVLNDRVDEIESSVIAEKSRVAPYHTTRNVHNYILQVCWGQDISCTCSFFLVLFIFVSGFCLIFNDFLLFRKPCRYHAPFSSLVRCLEWHWTYTRDLILLLDLQPQFSSHPDECIEHSVTRGISLYQYSCPVILKPMLIVLQFSTC